MALPNGAKLEKVLPGGIAIYDVSDVLPSPARPRFNRRPRGVNIIRVFFHHSGAYGKDGFEGAENSVNFVINQRNFGARPYHYWLAYKPDRDEQGNIVIYRLAKDDERAWHTGNAANDNGIGVVWQGNLHPDHDGNPSPEQYRMAEALTKWLLEKYDLPLPNGLSFHAEAKKWGANKNKPSCPGPFVQAWVEERRTQQEVVSTAVDEGPPWDGSASEQETTQESEEPVQVMFPKVELKPPANPLPKPINAEKPASPKRSWFKKAKDLLSNNLFPGKK